MTVTELKDKLSLEVASMPLPDREIKGAYIGDLLSWVMSKAKEGNVWITIMSNINVVAVASLTDVSCVILAEGVTLADSEIETAKLKGVNILMSKDNAFEISNSLCGMV